MEKKEPRIVTLGPFDGDNNSDDWKPDLSQNRGKMEDLVFLPLECSFVSNQNSELTIGKAGNLIVTAKQDFSTPGFKLENEIILEPGNYELEIIGIASVGKTFFPWVIEAGTKNRLTPTFHISTVEDSTQVPFAINERIAVNIGVLCHSQKIDDFCNISCMIIRSLQEEVPESSGKFVSIRVDEYHPNQGSHLLAEGSNLIVRAKPRSTPGAYAHIDVEPGSTLSIKSSVKMGPGCVGFLYVADRETGFEITKRNVVYQSANEEEGFVDEQYSFVKIPEKTESIRVGVLFSTASRAEEYLMTICSLEVVELLNIGEIVEKSYVLSLEHEADKFQICEREARRHQVDLERWIAVNGYDPDIKGDWEDYMSSPWNDYDIRLNRKAINKPGAWGYMLTMGEIFSDAIKKEQACIAIFDDDFILSKSFSHDFSRFIQQVGEKWDVLYLGASQWAWDDVDLDSNKGFYRPTENTNGTFGVIYRSTVFEDLLYEIQKMDGPFDSGALNRICTKKFKSSSFVSFPNIVIANVQKDGIRDSRSQVEYSRRFRWKLEKFPPWFTEWSNEPTVVRDEWGFGFGPEEVEKVVGVTTYNRKEYLQNFIDSFAETIDSHSRWGLIVADDGSTDGSLEWLKYELEPRGFGLIVIRNDSLGIARQSNSILSSFHEMNGNENRILFMCNDDIRFERPGWDNLYADAIDEHGYNHLVYFNPEWKDPLIEDYRDGLNPLVAYTNSRNVMGCFYTVKPGLLDEIGYFDEEEFPVRGHSHVDFTMRACRVGKNDFETSFDVLGSNEYISMETRDNYVRTNKILGIWESSQINDKKSLENREKVLFDDSRVHVPRRW